MKSHCFTAHDIKALLKDEKTAFSVPMQFQSSHAEIQLEAKDPLPLGTIIYAKEAWLRKDGETFYRIDLDDAEADLLVEGTGLYWRLPQYMPEVFSRFKFEVVNSSIERLQDITYAGCFNEGIQRDTFIPVHRYAEMWNLKYKKRGFGWDTNPWVWRRKIRKVL
jgi:hypothetical protein